MDTQPLYDLSPLGVLMLKGLLIALLPLAWVWVRNRHATPARRLRALTLLTLFLTFDLILFGAFTRLTDSGLGCPDWPGCYGAASPLGAHDEIHAAQAALPSGPVTWSKAWIEMVHRYLAMTVGALILVIAVASWRERRRLPFSPWWPTLTLAWVIVQGLFGKYTVTLKLYPAVVTLHLLGGVVLLALLAVQHEAFARRPLALRAGLHKAALAALAALVIQVALGGWVSTNYAVLACTGFPQCNGQWWPAMDAGGGFTVLRELGLTAQGDALSFDALVAIHVAHRLFAFVASLVLGVLAWRLWRTREVAAQRFGLTLAVLLAAQWLTGLSNVVLDWPLPAALAHTAGAAAMTLALVLLLARSAAARRLAPGTVADS